MYFCAIYVNANFFPVFNLEDIFQCIGEQFRRDSLSLFSCHLATEGYKVWYWIRTNIVALSYTRSKIIKYPTRRENLYKRTNIRVVQSS